MNVLKKTLIELGVLVGIGFLVILGAYFFFDEDDEEYYLESVQESDVQKDEFTPSGEDEIEVEEEDFVEVRINDGYLTLEVADDDTSRALGLMHREELDDDSGMIFVYEDEDIRSFWMKNVLIPLDMIFVSSDLEIVGFLEEVPPCKEEPCESYSIEEKAQYVIEVNAGWVDDNDISVGDDIEFIVRDPFGS